MNMNRNSRLLGAAAVVAFAAMGTGCETGSRGSLETTDDGRLIIRDGWRGDRPRASIAGAGTPATINGDSVTWNDLLPILSETAGGAALEEFAFNRLIEEAAVREGIVITPEDTQREQAYFAETISQSTDADPELVARLMAEVRRERNLGPARYAALLKRTAILRKLVADDVHVTNAAIEQMYEIRYGERFQARIITVASERTADDVRRRLLLGEPFGELAAEISTDASAERGGVIGAISPADPTYPSGLRAALRVLEPTELSPIIALDSGFAVLRLDEKIPAEGVGIASVRSSLERAVRLRQERLAMNEYGARLLDRADISVFDPHLSQSWRTRRDR